MDRAQLIAVCDTDTDRLGDVPSAAGVRYVTAFADVLANGSVHAVVLATPPSVHAAQCLAALDAGKHVFVEKPLAFRSRDAALLVDRVRASRRKLMVGHILRYHPALVRLTELVSSGRLGRVRHMHSVRMGTGDAAEDETSWWSLAPHDVSAMRAVVNAEATRVSACYGHPFKSGHRPIRATLSFSTGCSATVVVSLHGVRKTRRIVVVGTLGTAVFDDLEPRDKIRLYSAAPTAPDVSLEQWPDPSASHELILVSGEEPLVLEARRFVSGVLDDGHIPTDAIEGSAVVAVLEAGHRSLRAGGEAVAVSLIGARPTRKKPAPTRDARRRARQLGAAPGPDAPSSPASTAAGSSDE